MPSFRESGLESFCTLKGILIMRSIFGYYYKFSNSVPISVLLKLYCIACCIIIWCHIFVWSEVNSRAAFYDATLLIEITINMLISLFVEDEFSTLNDLISTLPTKQNLRLTYAVIISTIIEQIAGFTYSRGLFTAVDTALYMFQYISCIYGRLSLIYQADNSGRAIKTLCDSLKDKIEDMNMDAAEKRGHVEKFIDTFKQIINFSFDAKCQVMKFKAVLGYVCDFFRLQFMVYYIYEFHMKSAFTLMLPWYCGVAYSIFIICSPSMLGELANNHLDEMKVVLVDELIRNEDKKLRDSLYDALEYIDSSETLFSFWNGFPVSMNFILGFLNLCISYFIAFLQFKF